MKLRLRNHETKETLKLEFPDTSTLNDLRRRLNPSQPPSIHLSLNRKDELLSPSPDNTLRSLGVTSGDLIYYSLNHSAFINEIIESAPSSSQPQNNPPIHEIIESVHHSEEIDGSDPMDVEEITEAGKKRLSEPFFLKKVLIEKCGDTSELTLLALYDHAVMLESGFILLDSDNNKFSFSKELLSVSLKYSLPELVTREEGADTVTVRVQTLGRSVCVFGVLSWSSKLRVPSVYLDKNRFVPVIDLVMDNLKFENEGSSVHYREVFMFWRMVKDGLAIPLMIRLCDKAGLASPPCLMLLPTELKLKVLELVNGASVANMACVCTEMRYLASDNDLWKLKCVKEDPTRAGVEAAGGESVNWKEKFANFWRRINIARRRSGFEFFRVNRDPIPWFNGDRVRGPIGIPGLPAPGLGGPFGGNARCRHARGRFHLCPRCHHRGLN